MSKKPEYCGVANAGCLNPTGYAAVSGYCHNFSPSAVRWECPRCGKRACKACRDGKLCAECAAQKRAGK